MIKLCVYDFEVIEQGFDSLNVKYSLHLISFYLLLEGIFCFLGIYLNNQLFLIINIIQQLLFVLAVQFLFDYYLIKTLYCVGRRELESLNEGII